MFGKTFIVVDGSDLVFNSSSAFGSYHYEKGTKTTAITTQFTTLLQKYLLYIYHDNNVIMVS